MACPSSAWRSRVTARLFRFIVFHRREWPRYWLRQPRTGSPRPGCSTLMTSAPKSPSRRAQNGPAIMLPRSSTRRPASGPVGAGEGVTGPASSPRRGPGAQHAGFPQLRDLAGGVPRLCQDFVGVLVEDRRDPADLAGRLGELDRDADQLDGAVDGMRPFHQHPVVQDLRVAEHFREVVDWSAGDAALVEILHPFVARPALE